ncbi:MAG: phosphoribosylformylglycinamidine synthase subunit PurL [Armatimonadota bacterium]|nr:phosphoribosylformylglycinamidine synthase subunit PurL [Armatimonadota bacterium]MDR7452479.1 phosphoribosylformylglycinamidine synthase subunit PurL [Armatimonadota bacterium]MDR7467331.1 phosphoribosylformylglycinamidine synthase subunit PurL [Armatimonadota bacterium]MDR7494102.1 phosphoribosylformylglycinamidine synthase subunit PurL [Armatimonadota bacterium]MDR7498931.1 phosphoribosylformylglycinamidine synthase subunit PurL [Armatimonadota bacterium]
MSTTLPRLDPAAVGLTPSEYEEIRRRLGREPTALELQLFGVMWSEHCGYKHSRLTLRALPAGGPGVLRGPGENAGVVEIGEGWAVAFKVESHNHPSAVDPYNGAATGVGGIIRDVLAMGARPIALLDSLRFGPLDEPRARRLATGVVAGIAGYGNCIGVPTVGGEIHVDPRYRGNPLVNVVCLGLVRRDRVARARASGPGNVVMYVGARTGRDGIGGAAFASGELDERSEGEDRASVQIGDPFTGKLLIEATLEALEAGGVVALQDMGAAGLTCAASEMAARGGVGMRLDLDRVPLRESGMRADEILRSESQERMLLVVRPEAADRVAAVYRRWGLAAVVIGEVTAEPVLRIFHRDGLVVSLPPYALAEAPGYRPAAKEPQRPPDLWSLDPLPEERDPEEALRRLLASPGIASARAVYEQYDHAVQVRTVVPPGAGDAAVLRIPELAPRGLALAVDGNGSLCALDPYRGARRAVAECAANLACAGAVPLGVTDGLNFGNPEDPEVFWTFRQAVCGIADACRALEIPVVGGNVSFYNESPEGPIPPTPIVAMVGLVEDVRVVPRMSFRGEDDLIVLVGDPAGDLAASTYLREVHGLDRGRPQDVDLDLHRRVLRVVREAVRAGLVRSVHDVSEGGLAVALAESAIAGGIGAEIVLPAAARRDTVLFGEAPSRIILSLREEDLPALRTLARASDVPITLLGRTGGDRLRIAVAAEASRRHAIDVPLDTLRRAYEALAEVFR